MKEYLKECLYKIVSQSISFHLENQIIKTYDDSSGQRLCYLEHYGYGDQMPDKFPYLFKIKRKLAFINKGDEGKEGATLLVLDITNASDISISCKKISFNGLTIYLQNEIKFI